MPEFILSRIESNAVFKAAQEVDLNPSDFRRTVEDYAGKFLHLPTGARFLVSRLDVGWYCQWWAASVSEVPRRGRNADVLLEHEGRELLPLMRTIFGSMLQTYERASPLNPGVVINTPLRALIGLHSVSVSGCLAAALRGYRTFWGRPFRFAARATMCS